MTDAPEVKQHSELGASIAKRWLACPGSVRLARTVPEAPKTFYAAEGTLAHLIAERSLTKGVDPDMWVGMKYTIDGFSLEVTDDMADVVRVFVDHCRNLEHEGLWTIGQSWVERRFNLAPLNPPAPMFGTTDYVCWQDIVKELHVVDLKYGQGVVVEAEGNPQLRYYALGALLSLPHIKPELITMTIVQPRAGHPDGIIRSDTITYDELLGFASELIDAARATMAPDAPLNPGDHCRFCPAAGSCPAQAKRALAVAQAEFADLPVAAPVDAPPAPETLPLQVFAEMLGKLHILEDWAASMRGRAQAMLERGEDVPGFKLVEKRATRRWKDEKETRAWLQAAGYDDSETNVDPKLKSPAQIEKLVGKKNLPSDLTAKQSSGYNMVPATDPRPMVVLSAGSEFPAIPETAR